MSSIFMNYDEPKLSQAAYYRLLSPIIFDINRIIYLDGDTLTFKDLSEMFQMELKDNYILGILDFFANGIDYLGIKSERYINSGVLLFNLQEIRNDNKIYDLIKAIESKMILRNQDQTLVNYVFYPRIGIIPSKYVIFNHFDESDINIYLKSLRRKINFSEIEEALDNPTIIHTSLCWPKIWSINTKFQESFTNCKERNNCSCEKYHNLYYFYARKTIYYSTILKLNGKMK